MCELLIEKKLLLNLFLFSSKYKEFLDQKFIPFEIFEINGLPSQEIPLPIPKNKKTLRYNV